MQNDKNIKQNQNSPHCFLSNLTSPHPWSQELHTTAILSNVGRRITDVGCWMSDLGCRMSNLGCRMSDVESRMSDVGCQIWDVGCRMSDLGCESRMSNLWCPMSDVGCRIAPISFRRKKNPCCSIEKLVTRIFATYKSEFVYFRD